MHPVRFDRLDDLGKAGFLIALIGGLLALIPQLEQLLTFQTAWQEPMILLLLAGTVVTGALLAMSGSVAVGGLTAAVAGIAFAVFGPTAPGTVALIGGTLLYIGAEEERTTHDTHQEASQERSPTIRT